MAQPVTVSSAAELVAAAQKPESEIEVAGVLSGMPMLTLAPGVTLRGGALHFGAKGLQLTRDNTLSEISIETAAHEVAISAMTLSSRAWVHCGSRRCAPSARCYSPRKDPSARDMSK